MFKTEYVHAVEGVFIIFIGFITMSCAFQLTNSGAEAGGKIVMCLCEAGGFSFLSFSLSFSLFCWAKIVICLCEAGGFSFLSFSLSLFQSLLLGRHWLWGVLGKILPRLPLRMQTPGLVEQNSLSMTVSLQTKPCGPVIINICATKLHKVPINDITHTTQSRHDSKTSKLIPCKGLPSTFPVAD